MKILFVLIISSGLLFSCNETSSLESCSQEKTTCVAASAFRLNSLEPYRIELTFSSTDSRYEKEVAAIELQLASPLEESMSITWINENSASIEFQLKNGSKAKYKLDHLENKFHFRAS